MRRPDRNDRGSVLMLVPAGILVLLALAAMSIDSAIVWMAQRDLANRTAATADDIAGAALDDEVLYHEGAIRLRPEAAAAYTDLVFAPERVPEGYVGWAAVAEVDGATVTVRARAEVRYLFAPAIPGVARTATVQAASTAEARS